MPSTGSDGSTPTMCLVGCLVAALLPLAATAAGSDLQTDVRLLGQTFVSYASSDPGETRFVDTRGAGSLAAGSLQPGDVITRSGSGSFSRLFQPPEDCEGCGSIGVVGMGSGQVSARAAYGALGVSAMSSLDASWVFPQGAYNADAVLNAIATARFIDRVTVLSTLQPAGTPVQLALDSHLHLTLSLSGRYEFLVTGDPAVSVRYQVDVLRAGQALALPSFRAFYSFVLLSSDTPMPSLRHAVDVQVGDVLSVDVSFAAQAQLATVSGYLGAGNGRINATGTAAAMNSLETRIDVLSDGVALQSASGHNYLASPVPEPSAALLWLAALAVLCCRQRRALRQLLRKAAACLGWLALCGVPPASAQLTFELPVPQLELSLSLAATASSTGPQTRFDAGQFLKSTAAGAAALLPNQVYALARAGELHQSYSYDGTEDNPGAGSGYADLSYDGAASGRAAFGNLGVAASMSQSGSGFWYNSSPSGMAAGSGGGASLAESRASAFDSFMVLSTGRPMGSEVAVDFSVGVTGSVWSDAVAKGSSPFGVASLGVLRQVQVYRPGLALPVLNAYRNHWWQAGHEELGPRTGVQERLPWLWLLQVGDLVAVRISLVASVANSGGVPPGGDATGPGLFDASAHVDAMNSAHVSLVPDASDVQLLSASGFDYAAGVVPAPGTWAPRLAGLAALGAMAQSDQRESF